MSLTLIALAAAAATHTVPLTHQGTPVQAIYTARADVQTRTVGAKTPNRMDMQRCNWTATVVVDRKLDHGPALARTIASDTRFSGSESGACSRGKNLEQRVLAQHGDRIHSTLMAMAERDRAPLMAELDSVRALASN
ncbi:MULTISPECIES: hypothetical protein [unclassified Sphingobium]|uniref:hypothetical protein n=1 Tax=unclassified Sphingobium TaxID=2611147 RepID=UPI000BB57CF2|nr:hypothetical protein [Sphingobium sp. D43FB]PBN43648.1 hypothetical protein SxD43FB_09605 [Sphingobium sp. D43FB]